MKDVFETAAFCAGCAAFAVSFLRVLGLDHPSLAEAWKRRLDLPERLMTWRSHRSEIPFLDFLRGSDSHWAAAGEPAVPLSFWDPELMYQWVGAVAAGKIRSPLRLRAESRDDGKALSLVWDARGRKLPDGYFFLLPRAEIQRNAAHHRKSADRLLTGDELRNPLHHECRRYGYCRR